MKGRCSPFTLVVVLVFSCFVAGVRTAAAQSSTSVLTGTVVDGSGAVVPGATVTATHVATTTVRTGVSNEAGLFRIPALNPGQYSVVVDLPGFKSVTVNDNSVNNNADTGKYTAVNPGRQLGITVRVEY